MHYFAWKLYYYSLENKMDYLLLWIIYLYGHILAIKGIARVIKQRVDNKKKLMLVYKSADFPSKQPLKGIISPVGNIK